MQRRDIHERVLKAQSPDEVAAAYADWAQHYDADLLGEMGYTAPQAAVALLNTRLAEVPEPHILDAGCGTGLVGAQLHTLGYRRLTGLDYSAQMLEQARSKSVYHQLIQADLTRPLEQPDDVFDAVICVGTLTLGHVGPGALAELVRVTRQDGLLCFTVREEAWIQQDYASVRSALEDREAIAVLHESTIPYIEEEGSSCWLCLYCVL